jgi:hypothetical protein
MTISETNDLIEAIERAGGEFELETNQHLFHFSPGNASEDLVEAVFVASADVFWMLVLREAFVQVQPPEGVRVQ